MMDLQKWIDEWVTLETDEEKKDFDVRFRKEVAAIPKDKKADFQKMFYDSAVEAGERAEDLVEFVKLRKKLDPILNYISLSEIANKYFGKTRQWLYQRLNGNMVNGVPAKFSNEELKILKGALIDLSEKMKQVAQTI